MNRIAVIAALMAVGSGPAVAQAPAGVPAAEGEVVGTILVAHGGSDEWNAPVIELARQAPTGGPTEVALLMGDAAPDYRFQDAAARLVEQGATRIVVVPLLASSNSGHYEQIRYLTGETDALSETMMHHLHMGGIERPGVVVPVSLTPALDASMELATILAQRALHLAESPAEQALFVVGHGPNSADDYAEWMRNLRPVVDSIARATGFRDVKLGLVRDDAPAPVREEAVRRIREIIQLQHALTGQPVVVVPLLVSKGYVSTRKLPKDMENLPITYDAEGLLPHPVLAEWVARRVVEAGPGVAVDPPEDSGGHGEHSGSGHGEAHGSGHGEPHGSGHGEPAGSGH